MGFSEKWPVITENCFTQFFQYFSNIPANFWKFVGKIWISHIFIVFPPFRLFPQFSRFFTNYWVFEKIYINVNELSISIFNFDSWHQFSISINYQYQFRTSILNSSFYIRISISILNFDCLSIFKNFYYQYRFWISIIDSSFRIRYWPISFYDFDYLSISTKNCNYRYQFSNSITYRYQL